MSSNGYEQVGVAMTCRGFEEYRRMFGLTSEDLLAGEVLDVAAGASSFTADANGLGYKALAVDPRYALDAGQLKQEAAEEIDVSTTKLEGLQEHYDWTYYGNLKRHKEGRIASLERFVADRTALDFQSRYIAGKLPELPFESSRFSLVLCSHFLFLYGQQFDMEFHRQALRELIRVCRPGGQIRIYPLVTLRFERFPGLDQLLELIRESGASAEFRKSELPFIPGSSQHLNIRVQH
ncbi:class I SAM-dependent methyltransferase [Paenibacillus abyssi]|uniref:SAM-dependent methyltransferase n=1 Tax=Paenibacillus abyssi TaxID=1340531 RepID=A0A917FZT9_9BACL|nr:class I SAM-dependent methyltransferase [Paenibacillus abyssi]GGG15608.1 SAM-dependent methyltransferase [Paenibacillus abyssi]